MRFIGPGYSGRGGFDRKGKPGKLKESPRGTERKFKNSESACFLRTQQRAKSQCMTDVQTPVGTGFSDLGSTEIAMILLMVGFLVSGRGFLAGGSHSTESLILAQDERWRRA
jgi:hypothetical protein